MLADTCSYAEAAARLFMGQSSLSKHIKALEEELGLGLFERTSRRVRLSREGELLLPSARALVEAEFALEAQARRCRELSRGKLDLAALPSMPSYGITELISGFMAKRPDCLVNVTECRTSEAERALREGSCELAFIRRAEGEPEQPELAETEFVERDELVALLPERHRLAAQPELRLPRGGEPGPRPAALCLRKGGLRAEGGLHLPRGREHQAARGKGPVHRRPHQGPGRQRAQPARQKHQPHGGYADRPLLEKGPAALAGSQSVHRLCKQSLGWTTYLP